jgi:hypothetical protein
MILELMQPTCHLPDNGSISAMQVVVPFGCYSLTDPWPSRYPLSSRCLWPKTVTPAQLLLAVAFAFIILSTTALSQPIDRPETGTYFRDMQRDGYGLLHIHNNWTMDTVAVLADQNVKPLLVVYLQTGESIEITGINDGVYGLYFTIGDQWDESAGRFQNVYGYYRYNAPLHFVTGDAGDEIEYSVFELDLYEAGASNFLPDEFQFPDISS